MANKNFVAKHGLDVHGAVNADSDGFFPAVETVSHRFVNSGKQIDLTMIADSDGTLSFSGSAGQLFSITNSLSGTIFSVNDISGIPSIEVDDTGVIRLAEFSGNVLVGTDSDNATDKLQVNGSISATGGTSTDWNTAFGWGDHSLGGYLTSQTSHADVVVDGDFTSNGLMKRTADGVYAIVADSSANWNTAYGWGDHSLAGYTSNTGTVTSVASGAGLTGGPITTSGTLSIDLTDTTIFAEASTASRVAVRNSSGDINARLFRSEYDVTNATIGYIMTQVDTVSNNYMRPSTPTQLKAALDLSGTNTGDNPGVTAVNNGNGMNFTNITSTGTVTLGTPSTLTAATTNEVTASSHTHAITGFATDTHNHTLDSSSNVTITANSSGEILKWNGAAWINNTLAEAGIGTVTSVSSGDGLTGGPITTSGSLAVDSTVVRTTGTQSIGGVKTFTSDVIANVGISLGSNIAASATDLSQHLAVYGTNYGINARDAALNIVANNVNTLSSTASRIDSRVNHDFAAGIDVTGNITVTGTVDGRDVATDGTKLDGIASGAQTGTVTSVSGGDGLSGTVTTSGSLDVDSTVVRTTGTQSIGGIKTFTSDCLMASGADWGWEGGLHLITNNDGGGNWNFRNNNYYSSGDKHNSQGKATHFEFSDDTTNTTANLEINCSDNQAANAAMTTNAKFYFYNASAGATNAASFRIANGGLVIGSTLFVNNSMVLDTGVTAVTQTAGDNSAKLATTAYTDTAISNLVDAAPGTLDTLNELAAALGDDPNFATTVTNSIATKVPLAGGTMTGQLTAPTITLTTDATDTLDNRFAVYDNGVISYGMTLWNSNGTAGDWATMIYASNQANRRISFGKTNNAAMSQHSHITEIAHFDLDDSTLRLTADAYVNANKVWHEGDFTSTQISNWDTAFTYSGVGHIPLTQAFSGDVTGTYGATVVGDDTHNHSSSTGAFTVGGDLTVSGGNVFTGIVEARVKYSLWNNSVYGIGFQTGYVFGGLLNDYTVTNQTSSDAGRGFWWGTNVHTNAQGAMALTNDGKLTVAHSARIGFGINDTTTPGTTYALEVSGAFAATTKSFLIDHPTKEGKKLRHGSLEGPENGVYVRGRLTGDSEIELPEYWLGLVDADTITVNLTGIGRGEYWVEDIVDNKVIVGSDRSVNCFYTVFAERKDVEPLEVEIDCNNDNAL